MISSAEKWDISIPLRFNGPQPNAYGVERAISKPVEAGALVGDTRRGGSVNFEQYTFIPHCNGTHTECVGHITHERISVRECLKDVLIGAVLVSVEPETIDGDLIITRGGLLKAGVQKHATSAGSEMKTEAFAVDASKKTFALIVRTLPNDESKLTREYGTQNAPDIPPYLTADAMHFIVSSGFNHLLVDLPSIDRIYDDGKLINHRIFWNIAEESFEVNSETRIGNTITELIYAPNEVKDGEYILNLQIAPFDSDCAPSRPVLLKKR